jgi:7-cyano-7-deazaguanine reductase
VTATNLPLGLETDYPQKYAPEVLCPVSRAQAREALGLPHPLPFSGVDIWNAWELTWLDGKGLPRVATAQVTVPAESPHLIESKSLKLYLGSFAMSRYEHAHELRATIARDLAACAGAGVEVALDGEMPAGSLTGRCIDQLDVACNTWEVAPELLAADRSDHIAESVHTHLLRSLCPVTGQPDIGSLLVSYEGPRIDPGALLRYVVSFRQHNDFHEACVERIFVDILERCRPGKLSVYARYQRRGGIDINPFRSNTSEKPQNLRLWRQ